MRKNSVSFNRCVGFVLNMSKKHATKESGLIFTVSQHPVYQIQGMHVVDLNYVCAKKMFIQIVDLTTACFKIQEEKVPVNNDLEK